MCNAVVDSIEYESEDEISSSWNIWGEVKDQVFVCTLNGALESNDYANAFHMAAPYWAERGVKTYAYDQRGFGRSYGRGEWPESVT